MFLSSSTKFASALLIALTPLLVLPTHAQTPSSLSYDAVYGTDSTPLSQLACSNGANGLGTKYPTLGSLKNFPNVGASPTVAGWNDPNCGKCYTVTYGSVNVNIVAVDVGRNGFVVSEQAMNTLTGDAEFYGRVDVTYVEADLSACQLP
ncbi:hypothetical protein SCLCIDRAFT_445914 [Scleroderma citrinum Foug A]|uniref:Cerato-platanin n=1 Tax=Scleroderma citrinum Foug A TaxID=1036808 RepID=A0A0C3AL84_9AGAM|nr:hypothetical protein SCLCIDRAFT_445914 [Scleroderma citrinum Foug A]